MNFVPTVVDDVEVPTDVRIQHPVHLLPHQSDPQRIQRVVRATPRPETAALRTPPGSTSRTVSAFADNSGVMRFYDGWAICGKVETHNSPSAIEPYGAVIALGLNPRLNLFAPYSAGSCRHDQGAATRRP